jgi:hypothetical protein
VDIEGSDHKTLKSFYISGYKIIRKHSPTALVVFNELYSQYYSAWKDFAKEPEFHNVV